MGRHVARSQVELAGCHLSAQIDAREGGAAFVCSGATLTLSECKLWSNLARRGGGALAATDVEVDVVVVAGLVPTGAVAAPAARERPTTTTKMTRLMVRHRAATRDPARRHGRPDGVTS